MTNSKNNKVYIININSIVYGIIFLLILISTIYFISKGIGDANVTIQSSGIYQEDQVMAIEAVANNVTGRINNVIAVSAIFFAIIVSSISVFQFVKVKDFDKEVNELLTESKMLKDDLLSSKEQVDRLKYEIDKIYDEKDKIKLDNVKTQLEFNIYKISNEFYKNGSWLDKVIELIDESINLAEKYPEAIDKIEVSKLYYRKAYALYGLGVKDDAIYLANRALDKVREKYPDMEVENIRDRDYVEDVGMFLINIYLEDNDEKLVQKVIDRIEKVLDWQLDDTIAYLNLNEVEEAIKIIQEKRRYYGEYFLKKFRKHYCEVGFEKFNDDERFINLIESFGIKL
ncbi:hypothetical protein H8S10_04990 [Clostridium sp. NSJ-49]|uniref:hypothetical protein n=1 Tax=Clostridium TaxID=1485 RepID=UPI00164CC299|nr:hypothetical protein [Clostridium sp. NSJ-49]MBC5624809.1 hypothetical protein [Clostridium sp. NSJ-49]